MPDERRTRDACGLTVQHMSHSHDHSTHDHSSHGHAPADFGKAFAVGIALNIAFVVLEAAFGVISNSMALIADAGHNLSDVLGLVVAWGASILARRRPTARYTYGLRGTSILAALFNAIFLLVAIGAIAWEAVLRLFDPAAGRGADGDGGGGRSASSSTASPPGCSPPAARTTSTSAAPTCTWRRTPPSRPAWSWRDSSSYLTGWLWLDPLVSLAIAVVIVCRHLGPAARQRRHVARRRAGRDRSGRGARVCSQRSPASAASTTCTSGR